MALGFFYLLDPVYWMIIGPALLLALGAQLLVKGSFAKWSRVATRSGATGAQVAAGILRRNGLDDVDIKAASGMLSDHYDPRSRVVALSEGVYGRPTVAAAGVAAHEVGHAMQHARGSVLMGIRSLLVPVAAFSNLAIWLILIGFLVGALGLAKIGIFVFAGSVLFQMVTLPVELDASRRAGRQMEALGVLSAEEIAGARAVLRAAALTYVAAAAVSVAYLLYFLLQAGLLGGRD